MYNMNSLTIKEKEVLKLIILGCSNKQIAKEIGKSIATVKSYVAKLLQKFNVKNRIQLAYIVGVSDDILFLNK